MALPTQQDIPAGDHKRARNTRSANKRTPQSLASCLPRYIPGTARGGSKSPAIFFFADGGHNSRGEIGNIKAAAAVADDIHRHAAQTARVIPTEIKEGIMSESIKINGCPFCGGSASINQRYSPKQDLYLVFMKCDICGAQGKIFTGEDAPSANEWNTKQCHDAIGAWNMRHRPE